MPSRCASQSTNAPCFAVSLVLLVSCQWLTSGCFSSKYGCLRQISEGNNLICGNLEKVRPDIELFHTFFLYYNFSTSVNTFL